MKRIHNIFLILPLLFFSCKKNFTVNTGQSESFMKFYGTAFENTGNSIQQLPDGGYILTGESTKNNNDKAGDKDLIIMRLDKFGNLKWQKLYGGNGSDEGRCLKITSDGGYIVTGLYRDSIQTNGFSNIYILRLNAEGDTIWTHRYGESFNAGGNDVIQTADLGFVVAGFIESTLGNKDNFILKLDATGTEEWHKSQGFSNNDETQKIVEIPTGFIISGYAYINPANSGMKHAFLAQTGATGSRSDIALIINSEPIESGSFVILSDKSYAYMGTMAPVNGENKKIILVTIPEDIKKFVLSSKTISINGSNSVMDLIATNDGFVFTGIDNASNNLLIAKCDLTGQLLFNCTYGDEGIQKGNSIISTLDGGFAITGINSYTENGNSRITILKTRADGKQ